MRFHVIGLPHTSVTKQFSSCAYTDRIRKWCNMMTDRGHEVFLYAGPENEARVAKFFPCVSETGRAAAVGSVHYTSFPFDTAHPLWRTFIENVNYTLKYTIRPKDFICLTAGVAHQKIADAFPEHIKVEIMIGYGGVQPYTHKVFESYAWMHSVYAQQRAATDVDGRFFDDVIPPNYELQDFPVKVAHDDTKWYFLYMGRMVDRKGWKIAEQVARDLKKPIIFAGSGDGRPTYGEYVGEVGPEKRAELMGGATVLFAPTQYIEPFGNVAVEAQLCGTPVISTDWGAFTETVINGMSGYRCRTLSEFKDAANRTHRLSRDNIAKNARKKYSSSAVGARFERYFKRLETLWGDGWYARPV